MRSKRPAEQTRIQQVRRQDIIEAAITVINTQGYAAASIMAIAKEAKVSKGTVMYHFSTKEELMAVIIQTAYSEGAAYMKPRIDAATTMSDKLEAYITSNIAYLAEHARQIAAVHQVMLNTTVYDDGGDAIQRLELLFLKGRLDGEFGDFDAKVMAIALRHVIDGASFYILQHPELDTDAYAASISQLFKRATANIT